MSFIASLLAAAESASHADPSEAPLLEAQITTLNDVFDVYGKRRFKPGELVTPTEAGGYVGRGTPFIVLEVLDTPIRNFDSRGRDIFANAFGHALDVRVFGYLNGWDAYWQESWRLESFAKYMADAPVAPAEPPSSTEVAKAAKLPFNERYVRQALAGAPYAVGSAFTWAHTPQGQEFWEQQANAEALNDEARAFLQELLDEEHRQPTVT